MLERELLCLWCPISSAGPPSEQALPPPLAGPAVAVLLFLDLGGARSNQSALSARRRAGVASSARRADVAVLLFGDLGGLRSPKLSNQLRGPADKQASLPPIAGPAVAVLLLLGKGSWVCSFASAVLSVLSACSPLKLSARPLRPSLPF
jgi:hypothetical protein